MPEIKLEEITPEEMETFKRIFKKISNKGGLANAKRWANMTEEEREAYREQCRQRYHNRIKK